MDEDIKNQDSTEATQDVSEVTETPEVTEPAVETVTLTFSELFDEQPTVIQSFIMDAELDEKRREIYEQSGLTEEEADMAAHLELEVLFGLVPLSEYPDLLWSRLTWDDSEEDRAVDLAIQVLGNIFLPAQVFLGDVAGEIFSLGGDPKKFKVNEIDVRKLTFDEGVDGIVRALGSDFVDPKRLPRLRYLIETRLRGVRDDNEFREQLMRPVKVGGLELSAEAADRVLEIVRVEMQLTTYVEVREESQDQGGESDNVTNEYSSADIKRLYSGTKEEREQIKKRVDRFRKVTEDDPQKMADAFHEVLYPPDLGPVEPSFVLAGLLSMADSGVLMNLLRYDDRFSEMMLKYYVDKGLEAEIERFNDNSTSPEAVNVFLQLMLRGFAGYQLDESARFGLRTVNLLKRRGKSEYANLAAFDSSQGNFRWLDVIEL